jgi:hypothetical protein
MYPGYLKQRFKEVKPFTNIEILRNYKMLIGRSDFSKYFTRQHLMQAEIIFMMLNDNKQINNKN